MVSKKNKIRIIIIVLVIVILFVAYSAVVCNKTQVKTSTDEAILILDSFYVLFESYKSENDGKLSEILTPGLNAKQFQQILGFKSEYLAASSTFTAEEVILSKVSPDSGKYEISIKSADNLTITINETARIIAPLVP